MLMIASRPDVGLRTAPGRHGTGGGVPAARRPDVVGGRGRTTPARGGAHRARRQVVGRRRGRSRRRARRRSRTSRTTRRPATGARRRPGGRGTAASATASSIDAAVRTGRRPSKAAATSGAASPMATTARMRSTSLRQLGQVEALVAPAGDQHDRVEAAQRRPGGVGRGGLRVVVPAHPTSLAHQAHPMGEPPEGEQRLARAVRRVPPPCTAVAAAASALARSCGKARCSSLDLGERVAGVEHEPVAVERGCAAAASSPKVTCRRAAPGRARAATTGSSALPMATWSARLVLPEPRLGGDVVVEGGVAADAAGRGGRARG